MVNIELADGNSSALVTIPGTTHFQVRGHAMRI